MRFPPERDFRTKSQGQNPAPGFAIHRGRFLLALVCLAAVVLASGPAAPAAAQSAARVSIQPPDLSAFPKLSIEFKAFDSDKRPIAELQPEQITLRENGVTRPVDDLARLYRGVHFALVINGNREMDLRDGAGVSRFEKLSDVLRGWASEQSFRGEDAWSLVTNAGILIPDTDDPRAWLAALNGYQPNFRALQSDLAGLDSALEMMQEGVLPFGMDRTILFITPPAAPDQIAPLGALMEEARSAGIRVNVWMVGDAFYLTNDQGRILMDLAASTGGQFFNYTGLEEIPSPADLQAALGYVQVLSYTSAIAETGTHSLVLTLELGEAAATGEAQPFYLEVLPPNPMFLSPPAAVERTWVEGGEGPVLTPAEAAFSVLVQFPDGHPRDLAASRLLVDGTVAAVNRSAPFDTFTWDLAAVTESGEHTLQVEVEDMLGLTAVTIEMPVQVRVPDPEPPRHFNWQKAGAIAAGVVAAAAVLLLLSWSTGQAWRSRQVRALRDRLFTPPMEAAAATVPPAADDADALATLVPEESFLGVADPACLHLRQPEVTFSTDPDQPGIQLTGLDHQKIQAKISLREGAFWLQSLDHGRGVWLNYRPVGETAVSLRPGDLVHFGNSGFRFTINTDSPDRKVTVSKYEPLI